MEKYLKYAEYDLEVSDSESTVALDQVALSNIDDGHRFYDADDGDEERAEKGKPNTSPLHLREWRKKSEAFLAAGESIGATHASRSLGLCGMQLTKAA